MTEPDPRGQLFKEQFITSLGGIRGMFDSGLPIVVFIVANAVGGLSTAVWAAVGAGLFIVALRLVRKQTVQQAVSGFLGVAIAALIARQTGEAKGFFLLGIWSSLVYAGIFGASVLVRRPLTGVIWEYLAPTAPGEPAGSWRSEPILLRVYSLTTLLWTLVYVARFFVQQSLYQSDQTGWLAAARLAMGYPLTFALLGATLLLGRRARGRVEAASALRSEQRP